ncbi:MAG: hypothetical protein AAFV53_07070 [Myxococcota bacterium]
MNDYGDVDVLIGDVVIGDVVIGDAAAEEIFLKIVAWRSDR